MILVVGASGFIGSHLVPALAAHQEVRALVRSDASADKVRESTNGPVEIVTGDLGDEESLRKAAAGCDLVYHLGGTYRGDPAQMRSSHGAGTAKLLRALDESARLVLVSSTSVYGWDRPWPADHLTPPRPASAYGKAKLAAEHLALSRPEGNVVVARPTITYGPGDTRGMLPRAVRLLSRRGARFPGTGDNRVHLLHVDDLVAALLLLGDGGEGVFVLGGPEAAPIRHILELLAQGAGAPPPRFGLPTSVLRPLARAVEASWSTAGLPGEPPLSSHSVDVATRDRAYSWARAADELGWCPRVSLEEGVPAVGAWLASRKAPTRALPGFEPTQTEGGASVLGFDWRGYFEDPDEGLGTVYERFALAKVLEDAVAQTGAQSVLHAPLFGMMGIPGLDAVFLARRGLRVGLVDFDEERLHAVSAQWSQLGVEPETHLVPGPDPRSWPHRLSARYDLSFSFAALWWFDDPWAVLAAQARWADRGVLSCVPNKNVFMKMRARLWHKDLFERLNEDALDPALQTQAAEGIHLRPVDTGLFDIPPFPDTSVPLAKVVRAAFGRRAEDSAADPAAAAWTWSILPYLQGEQDDLEDRIDRLTVFERHMPSVIAPAWAHHRYTLFVPDPESSAAPSGVATHTA